MTQFFNNAEESIAGVLQDGMLIHAGGFGLCGIPENIISAIVKSRVKNLTIVSNNCGIDDFGLELIACFVFKISRSFCYAT